MKVLRLKISIFSAQYAGFNVESRRSWGLESWTPEAMDSRPRMIKLNYGDLP